VSLAANSCRNSSFKYRHFTNSSCNTESWYSVKDVRCRRRLGPSFTVLLYRGPTAQILQKNRWCDINCSNYSIESICDDFTYNRIFSCTRYVIVSSWITDTPMHCLSSILNYCSSIRYDMISRVFKCIFHINWNEGCMTIKMLQFSPCTLVENFRLRYPHNNKHVLPASNHACLKCPSMPFHFKDS